jgi:hypothetical protein
VGRYRSGAFARLNADTALFTDGHETGGGVLSNGASLTHSFDPSATNNLARTFEVQVSSSSGTTTVGTFNVSALTEFAGNTTCRVFGDAMVG